MTLETDVPLNRHLGTRYTLVSNRRQKFNFLLYTKYGDGANEKVAAPVKKTELTTGGIRCADHATPSISKKLALTSPTSGGSRSV
jgi:hypothetical protein